MSNTKDIVAYLISENVTVSQPKIIKNNINSTIDTVEIDAELQDASEFNRNTRQYPKKCLNEGLTDPKITELITRKSWVGEAGHPMNPTVQRQMAISHDNISHRICNWRWEGSKVCGRVETLMTNRGKEMRDLIRQKLEVAFSLRALGPVEKTRQGLIVQSPLSIVTYDWVFLPSHKNSYMRNIVQDGPQDNSTLSESYCVPINNLGECVQYIQDESKDLKLITESLDFDYNNIILSEDLKTVELVRDSERIVMKFEKYISNDITNYMSKLRR